MNRRLTCYIEGSDNQWEAICLDFDIAVQGISARDVEDHLLDAIRSYLEYAYSLPEAERAAFLDRQVPLFLRLKFVWNVIKSALFKNISDQKERHYTSSFCPG